MKNINFKNSILFCCIATVLFANYAFAEVVPNPSNNSNKATSPLNDPLLNPGTIDNPKSSIVTADMAKEISKIIIMPSNNSFTSTPVAEPSPITSTQIIAPATNLEGPNTENIIINSDNGAFTTNNKFSHYDVINTAKPNISSPEYILVNTTTGHIYLSKDMDNKLEPAGLANLMTAYLATQKFQMDSVLYVKKSAITNIDKDAAIADLAVGDTITLKDAIASMFVKGCVDVANVIAENVSSDIPSFVKLMNDTALSLNMTNTTFVNPSGISSDQQFSSAYDMSIIMSKVCANPELVDLLHLSLYVLPKTKKREQLILYSKNTQLLNGNSTYNENVACSRMGYNSNSKYCISSAMNYNNCLIIATILKSSGTQFSDTRKLLEFGKKACDEEFQK